MKMFCYSGCFNMNLAVVIALLLAGCASIHERDQQAIADVEAKYEMLIDAQPILYLLEDKIKLRSQKDWAIGQFADRSFANESQKEAIAVYDHIATATNEALMEIAKKRDAQGKAAIFSDWVNASKENRAALYERTISFGVFNQNSKILDEAMQSLGNKLATENAEKAHTAWRTLFKSWNESLKINQAVSTN